MADLKVRELFSKDPLTWHLANDGVSSNNTDDLDTLRYELETFVCQGEYEQADAHSSRISRALR